MGICRYPFTITAKWERKRGTTFKDRVLTAEEMKTKWLFLLHPSKVNIPKSLFAQRVPADPKIFPTHECPYTSSFL